MQSNLPNRVPTVRRKDDMKFLAETNRQATSLREHYNFPCGGVYTRRAGGGTGVIYGCTTRPSRKIMADCRKRRRGCP